MSGNITPAKARDLAAGFLAVIPEMAPAILTGTDLRIHQSVTARAQVLCELPANAATCREIEECLDILVNRWMDAPLFVTTPRSQAKEILDTFEIVGSAYHAAAASGEDVAA